MELKDLVELRDQYQKTVKAEGKKILRKAFSDFFEAKPQVTAVQWTQTTPSFNDGDPCLFGVGDFVFRIGGDPMTPLLAQGLPDYGDDNEEADPTGSWPSAYGDEAAANFKGALSACKKLENDLHQVSDVLEAVFGNGAKIVAHPKGFEVSEYYSD